MTESIKVAVRVRPFLPAESAQSCIATNKNQITIGDTRSFAFDIVYSTKASGDEVYVGIGQPLADAFLTGYNTSTIAYGQTGSGKTYTMSALTADVIQEIFCRLEEDRAAEPPAPPEPPAAEDTAAKKSTTGSSNAKGAGKNGTNARAANTTGYSVRVSVLEVYNEALGDLLALDGARRHLAAPAFHNCVSSSSTSHITSANTGASPGSPAGGGGGGGPVALQLREEPKGGVYVAGLTEVEVKDEDELLMLVDRATANRKTASTLMNATSSRSHCVVTLTLVRKGIQSRFCFVDLAGSERLKRSLGLGADAARPSGGDGAGGAAGDNAGPGLGLSALNTTANAAIIQDRMREGISINSGLLALGNVIVALCEKKPHVPYRSSKLTRLLQPMLGGNSRTAMIACVSPHASSLEESLNTLKYADRAKSIKTDPHLVVTSFHSEEEASRTILALHQEVEQLRAALAACSSEGPAAPVPLFPPSEALQEQLVDAQAQLVQEQQLVKRLQEDLFNAEYTAMIEVEKRKALEARVTQLETGGGGDCSSPLSPADGGRSPSIASAAANGVEAADARLSTNLRRLEQLEAERDSLRALKAQQEAETTRLHRELREDGAADQSALRDGQIAELSEEINAGVKMIAELEKERDTAVRRLAEYQSELVEVGGAKERLEAELARAEAQLEVSEAARQDREEEKRKLHDTFSERIRRAEEKAAEYRRRVRQAEQEVRLRTTDLEKTQQLQERVETLREEVTRQRNNARLEQLKATQMSAAHTQEVMQLQLHLRGAETKITKLETQLQRKDDEIARTKRKISQWRGGEPPTAAAAFSRRESRRAFSPTRPQRRETLPSSTSFGALPGAATDKTQMAIDAELKCLERLEQELAELQSYRDALAQARTEDRPKWERALQGFQQHLLLTEQRFAAATAAAQAAAKSLDEPTQRKRAIELERLRQERKDVKHKLSQLQGFQYMFEETALQIAEFDNRIDSLNETRRYHLTQVRQLQQEAAAEVRRSMNPTSDLDVSGEQQQQPGGAADDSTASSVAWGSAMQMQQSTTSTPSRSNNASRIAALPSVREIRTSRKRLQRGGRAAYNNNNTTSVGNNNNKANQEYVQQLEAQLEVMRAENEAMKTRLATSERESAKDMTSPGSK